MHKHTHIRARARARAHRHARTYALTPSWRRQTLLYRCRIDASRAWRFVCPACWPGVSGGVTDGNRATHPWYAYGGTWKYFKR